MKVTVLVIGRVREPYTALIRSYEERARHYWKLEVVELDSAGTRGASRPPTLVRREEGERLRTRIPPGSELWALTREGGEISSEDLARTLADQPLRGSSGVTFLIGGAFGLDESLMAQARRRLSLSAMTLPHGMARLILAEQLYRAGTILRGEPYHKGGE